MSAHSSSDRRKPLDVDSTQRMRAFTPTELYDSHRPKSYAVQLVVSDRPVNLDMMPRLEVFAAHRLYTIAAEQQNGTWHALRLGFFPDEESAQVLCGYLQTFFSSPSIVRVSEAEQTRFAPQAVPRAAVKQAAPISAPAAPRPAVVQKPIVAKSIAAKPIVANKPRATGPANKTKTLAEQLLNEAREVHLARSGRKPAPEQSGSWLARLLGGSKPRPRST
jgi:hypothetical protein